MRKAKTYEEHLHYLQQIIKLKLWFVANWLCHHPDEAFKFVLRWRVDIFRKTPFWQGQGFPTSADFQVPGWLALERQVHTVYEETGAQDDPSAFERRAFEVLWSAVEVNAWRDYEASIAHKGFQCGSLGYAPPFSGRPALVHVHITNAVQPRSIFDDSAYLPRCFVCLMDKAEAEYGADSLGTATWLNSHRRWLELFPQEYADNMGPEEDIVWNGLGFWGQFLDARGTFDEQRADYLRKTGRMPYPRRNSWCSFDAMRRHLSGYLSCPQ